VGQQLLIAAHTGQAARLQQLHTRSQCKLARALQNG
jgi:hypothetical protein